MIKQAVRLAIVVGLWKRYKAIIVSVLILLTYLLLLSMVHGEFLDYSRSLGSKDNVGLSFVLKWLLGFSGLMAFFTYHFWWRGRVLSDKSINDVVNKPLKTEKNKAQASTKTTTPRSSEPDPFQALRDKQNLRSRGDLALDQNKKSDH